MAEFDMNAAIIDPLAGLSEPIEKPSDVIEKVETVKPVVDPTIDTRLQQIQNSVQGNELLTKVLSIPGVQDLLRAQQNGMPFKVLTGNDVSQSSIKVEEPVDWEKLKDDPQAMSKHLISSISAELAPILEKQFSSRMEPLVQKLNQVEVQVGSQAQTQVNTTMEQMKKSYPDFDQMRPLMAKLNAEVNGAIGLEELYKFAKVRSGQPFVNPKEVETERPTDTSARLPVQTQKKTYPPGRRGMKQAIADAVGNFDLDSLIQQ